MTTLEYPHTVMLNGIEYEVVKPARLRGGIVVKSGNTYGRIGPKQEVLEEQIHTISLYERGFPVAQILESGQLDEGRWFFTEESLGNEPFHTLFVSEYVVNGKVSDETFNKYLTVIERYVSAQVQESNRTTVSSNEFINALLPENQVTHNYTYFGYDIHKYRQAIERAAIRLKTAPMGILQYDLNPYNILENGIIDFEVVGYGPIGYDTLTSARWAGGWYPSYVNFAASGSMAYMLTDNQVLLSDTLINRIAKQADITEPSEYREEFLLLRTAWACSGLLPTTSDMATEIINFRHYRSKLLEVAVDAYLDDRLIPVSEFHSIKV